MIPSWCLRLWLFVVATQLVFVASAQESKFAGLEIVGLQAFSQENAFAAVEDQWEEIVKRGISPSRANDAAFLLNLALRQQGFIKSQVDWRRMGESGLKLTVQEGARLMLGKVIILGSSELDAAVLERALIKDLKGRQSLLSIDSELPFVRRALDSGVQAIETYAIYEGYLKASAVLEKIEPSTSNANKMDVLVRVLEGPKFTIQEVIVEGAGGRLGRKLRQTAELYRGQAWNLGNTRKLQGELLGILNDSGYFDAIVVLEGGSPNEDRQETLVPIKVLVEPGKMYQVDDVLVTGYEALGEDFVKQRFRRLMGEPYDPIEVRKVFRDLAQTGLYENVEITPGPLENGRMHLLVDVEEAKHKDVGVFGGFGSFDGYILGLTHSNRNLFYTGRSFRSHVEISGRGAQGELNYVDRWLFDSRWQLGAQMFTGTRFLEGYDKWEIGARVTLTYPVSEHTQFSLFAEWAHVSLTENNFVDVNIGPEDYEVQAFGVALTWDHSNDLETDGHGYLLQMSVDYAIPLFGDDVHFVRGNVRLSHYWSLFWDTELRLGVRVGAMVPLGDANHVPVDLRFFNGGSRSVRSFPEREVGPQDRRHHPLGGEFYTVASTEYAIPIVDSLKGALFADAGNVLSDIQDAGLTDMHYAAGLGLRYDLPVGPLRLDYGFNLNREKGEPKGSFHIAFGFAF